MRKLAILPIVSCAPTPDVIAAWQSGFTAVEDSAVERGGFMIGSEIWPGDAAEPARGPGDGSGL